ncbi:hypothetical protein phi1422_0003 [Bdellovibrio phage phi1422]|nr:hypothetical protein F395_gp03 [Bdellovibrio phage phi1422]AFC22523.1 hypothetical protein phi1422_0003 [Bdellovibrio phage phi1422]
MDGIIFFLLFASFILALALAVVSFAFGFALGRHTDFDMDKFFEEN